MDKLLASIVLNKYTQCMSNYFNCIQDNTLDYIRAILYNLNPTQKIKFITHTLFTR